MAAELLGRTTVHKGRIFQIEIDVVKLPTGHTVDMEIVRHPGSVVLIPIPEPGSIVLIRQYRYTIDRWIWELPAGSLKPKRIPTRRRRVSAKRREPGAGTADAPARLLSTPGFCDEEMIYYRCEIFARARWLDGAEGR